MKYVTCCLGGVMNLLIDCDNTISINRQSLVDLFNSEDGDVRAALPKERFHYSNHPYVEHEIVSNEYYQEYDLEKDDIDAVILFTMTPYENNYFFDTPNKVFVVSLAGWNHLTRVEMDVGIAFLICSIVIRYSLNIGESHDKTTGCINDFWWDKTGIDPGMRAAFICESCRSMHKEFISKNVTVFSFFTAVLDSISVAARNGKSIFQTMPRFQNFKSELFDIFLCHNTEDKEEVRKLNDLLKGSGLKTWFDEEQIEPGDIWQEKLEEAIGNVRACAIIVGDSGFGPWQAKELRAFISEFDNQDSLLIPVLVGEHEFIPKLPIFLKQYQYLDLRSKKFSDAYRLVGRLSRQTMVGDREE